MFIRGKRLDRWNIKEYKKWELVLHWCQVDVHGIEKEKIGSLKCKMQDAKQKDLNRWVSIHPPRGW